MSQQCSVLSSPKRQGPDGSWVASDLPLDNGFPRLPDPSFLAFGVCPLVIEASLEACSGFPVGGAGACPLVGVNSSSEAWACSKIAVFKVY